MKKDFLILSLLILSLLLVSACTNSTNVQSKLPTTTSITLLANQNKYAIGDIIAESPKEQVKAIVIYDYNPSIDKYQVDTIYTNLYRSWSYRLYPNQTWLDRKSVESTYPFLISNITISRIKTTYVSKESMDITNRPTTTAIPTPTSVSYYSSDDSGGGSSGQCWVNGYYRKTGVYVNGYYRRC
jgi:hypothetical protein